MLSYRVHSSVEYHSPQEDLLDRRSSSTENALQLGGAADARAQAAPSPWGIRRSTACRWACERLSPGTQGCRHSSSARLRPATGCRRRRRCQSWQPSSWRGCHVIRFFNVQTFRDYTRRKSNCVLLEASEIHSPIHLAVLSFRHLGIYHFFANMK